ncbi:MAG: LysR family transcriptional regulator [Simkaniaceae bacterium]|nr:LysR family transcriptional regulator [Candidatus Sacchlamyda saccharinae]
MDSFALECFLSVSRYSSFTEAAKSLRRTQPAVTQQILKLENELGKRLFERGGKITLTKDGEILKGFAVQIQALMRSARKCLEAPDIEGEISIGLPEDFASVFLTEILADFQRQHPHIRLRVECDLSLHLADSFKKGEVDLVLLKAMHPIEMPLGSEVWAEPLKWVGAKNFKENIASDEPCQLVLAPVPCVYRTLAVDALQQSGKKWQTTFVSPSYVGKIAAVEAGMGITVLPKTLIPKTLKVIDSSILPELPDLHVSLHKGEKGGEALDALANFLKARLKFKS